MAAPANTASQRCWRRPRCRRRRPAWRQRNLQRVRLGRARCGEPRSRDARVSAERLVAAMQLVAWALHNCSHGLSLHNCSRHAAGRGRRRVPERLHAVRSVRRSRRVEARDYSCAAPWFHVSMSNCSHGLPLRNCSRRAAGRGSVRARRASRWSPRRSRPSSHSVPDPPCTAGPRVPGASQRHVTSVFAWPAPRSAAYTTTRISTKKAQAAALLLLCARALMSWMRMGTDHTHGLHGFRLLLARALGRHTLCRSKLAAMPSTSWPCSLLSRLEERLLWAAPADVPHKG